MTEGRRYGRAYFDKWYRDPTYRVKSASELGRQVAFVVAAVEFILGRPVRSVLDVGCGEAQWRRVLQRHRPSLHYTGVDPSEYVVNRFGKQRNILSGSIQTLDALPLRESYDLVVCCGMLNYLSRSELTEGLAHIVRRITGMAYLELFTSEDQTEGDTEWPLPEDASFYRKIMIEAGLVAVGMQCYVPASAIHRVSSLELL